MDDTKRKELEESIRKRVALEERAFRVVERFLEDQISEEKLKDAAWLITPDHYADIVEERAISKLCGYPVCPNCLTSVPKKKYHISVKSNKVYDITDRKNFCSNQCYQASRFYKKQIPTTAVWEREGQRPPDITLLSLKNTKGLVGEEVLINPAKPVSDELAVIEKIDKTLEQKASEERVKKRSQNQGKSVKQVKSGKVKKHSHKNKSVKSAAGREAVNDRTSSSHTNDHQEVVEKSDIQQGDCLANLEYLSTRHFKVDDLEKQLECMNVLDSDDDESDDDDVEESKAESEGTLCGPSEEIRTSNVKMAENMKSSLISTLTHKPVSQTKGRQSADGQDKDYVIHYEENSVKSAQNTCQIKADMLKEMSSQFEALQVVAESGEYSHIENEDGEIGEVFITQHLSASGVEEHAPRTVTYKDVMDNVKSLAEQKQQRASALVTPSEKSQKQQLEDHAWTLVTPDEEGDKLDESSSTTCKSKEFPIAKVKSSEKVRAEVSPLCLIRKILLEWKTQATVDFLNCRKESVQKGEARNSSRTVSSVSELDVDRCDISGILGEEKSELDRPSSRLPDIDKLSKETGLFQERVKEFYSGKKPDTRKSKNEESTRDKDGFSPVMPLVDSQSQMALRRKVVLDRLNKVFPDLLLPLKLSIRDVSAPIRQLVHTFSLSSRNITLKPAEWTLLGFVLLNVIAHREKYVREAFNLDSAKYYFRALLLSIHITNEQIQDIVAALTTEDNN